MSIRPEIVLRADWRYYGVPHGSATRRGDFLLPALVSRPMGSSGTKKNRKGKHPQHLAKVGTPAENAHTMHAAERDVVGNFGVHSKGWIFWTAVVVIAIVAIGGIVTLALL